MTQTLYLAYVSGSLIPSMIAHAAMDILNFSYWYTDIGGRFERRPVAETGIDLHFVISILILVVSVALFVTATRKFVAVRQQA